MAKRLKQGRDFDAWAWKCSGILTGLARREFSTELQTSYCNRRECGWVRVKFVEVPASSSRPSPRRRQ